MSCDTTTEGGTTTVVNGDELTTLQGLVGKTPTRTEGKQDSEAHR